MIELKHDRLVFSFPEVHPEPPDLNFQRTLRIPDDGKTYPSAAGTGAFRCGTSTTCRRTCRPSGSSTAASCCRCASRRRCG